MAAAVDTDRSLNPTVEDYHSDDSDGAGVRVSYPSRPPTGQANVAAKRSQHSDLGADKSFASEKVAPSDHLSDSGYSSHTAATTMSSADSGPSVHSQSPPVAAIDPEPLPPASPVQRRPTLVQEERKRSSQTSPVKPLQRAPSVSSRSKQQPRERRPTGTSRTVDCKDPNCKECVPAAPRGRRPGPSPIVDNATDISSTRSDPVPSSYTPNSPTYNRHHASYMHGSAVVQPAVTRRRSSSTAPGPRPQSYHGDPGQAYPYNNYTVPAPYPSPPQEHHHPHGPPPAMSAHYVMQHPQHPMHPGMPQYPNPMYGASPAAPGFYQPAMQTSPPYEHQRPHMPSRNNSNSFNARGSMYGSQPRPHQEAPLPSARFPNPPQVPRQDQFPPQKQLKYHEESEDDYSSGGEEESEEEEEQPMPPKQKRNSHHPTLMAPPKLKPTPAPQRRSSPQRRPSLHRRLNTTPQVYQSERRMSTSQPMILPERPREQDPRSSRVSEAAAISRAPSKHRPSLGQRKTQSYDTTRDARDARVIVENAKSRRRQSQAYDIDVEPNDRRRSRMFDLEKEQSRSKIVQVEDRRRPREYEAAERRRPKVYNMESKRQSRIYDEEDSDDSDGIEVPPQRRRKESVYQEEVVVPTQRRRKESVYQDGVVVPPPRRRRESMYQEDVIVAPPPPRRRKESAYEEDAIAPQRRRKETVYDEDAIMPPPRRRNEDGFEQDVPVPLRRRKTVTEQDGRGSSNRQAKLQDAVNDIEAYQRQMRGNDVPLNDLAHKAAKRSSRVPSGPSNAGSSHSDGKTHISQSNRTTMTNGPNGDIRLRIDANAPISLQFTGDMEGRTLQINPADDGMNDIVIGGRGDESYRSERGSVYGGRRAITGPDQVRREAETPSVRSSHTSHSRHGSERRPHRRTRDIEVEDY